MYNRQLHPDERQWAKDNAKQFAQFYEDKTGQSITADQAQNILLANGYRLVDAAASKGPGGDATAVAFISQNAGGMFTATSAEYNSPFLYGNKDGSLTPEQRALPGAVANPKLGLAIAGALAAPAVLPALAAIPGAPIFGIDGALGSGTWTSSVGTGAISAGINAGSQYYQNGTVNPIDVAVAAISGGVGASGGLGWNVFVNGVGGSAGTAINNAIQQSQAAGSGAGDSRAKALHGIAAAGNAAMAVAGVTGGSLAGSNPSISVQLSYGTSQSKNTFTEDQTMQTGSTIKAGGTASFTATGGGDGPASPNNGNVTIAGSSVSGNNVALSAQNEVNLINTTNTDSTRSTNRSSSASVGVSYGTNGFGVSASMSNAHGDANSDAAMQNNTHVSAANNVSIVSGGNTSIVGADVSGNHVSADVGGNLNVQSVQDTTVSAAHQSSTSGGFSISQGGGNASFSSQHGSSSGNYAAVNGQAGIQAGNGGFDINVKGNTNLTGAYIASTADASKNGLTTGTLTVSDIQNHSDYSASSGGFSAGAGIGSTGKAVGPGSVSGAGGVTPMMSQHDSGSSSATTKSAISAGTISVTDAANQAQDVAGINRDTTDLNGRVSKLPDVNNLLSAQADTMNAAQAAGQVVAQGIGAYADMKRDQASDQATAASWDEGGTDRVALHVVGGALIGGLGGGGIGSAAAGAAGAGFASAFAGKLNGLADQIGDATGSMTLGNVVSNVLAGAGGALVGGSAGAFTASNADLYNRSTGNADGKGGTGNPFGIGKDLVSTVCGAGAQCSDATLNAAIQAQGANAAVASQNVAIYGPAAVGTAAAVALAPEALAGLALIPGAPIFSSGGALGSAALASPVGTGVISAGINAGSQYIQNGSINPIDVAGAFSTGVAGSYGGLLWNVGVNAFGGATTTALNNILQGKNDSVIGAGITSGVFSSVGYSAGSVTANTINSIMRPTVNNAGSWAGSGVWSGSGYNLFNPNNTAVIGGGFTGGTLQEIVQGAINGAQQAGNKK